MLIILMVLLPVCSLANPVVKKSQPLAEPFKTKKGKQLFQDNGCTLCHGEDGSGKGPMADNLKNKPRNFKDYSEMHRMPDVRIEQAIREGLAGTAMPAFPDLSQQDLEALTSYIRSFLIDSHTVVDMCLYETVVLDANTAPRGFRVEVDEPERLEFRKKGTQIHVQVKNWGQFLEKKSWRTHLRVLKGDRIHSLVTVKIKPCLNNLEQLVKSLPCKNP